MKTELIDELEQLNGLKITVKNFRQTYFPVMHELANCIDVSIKEEGTLVLDNVFDERRHLNMDLD